MSSVWGRFLRLSVFGESHGAGIGMVLDGFPAGLAVDFEKLAAGLARRAPSGGQAGSTERRESDTPEFLSGLLNGVTTGSPISAVIRNTNQRSSDYVREGAEDFVPRPGHADYTGRLRYGGYNDVRGGGHFSGRLTAPITLAGELCRQLLVGRGIDIGGHILRVGPVSDSSFLRTELDSALFAELRAKKLPTLYPSAAEAMTEVIEKARMDCDSVGGVLECAAIGLPGGIGSPIFGAVESVLSGLLFSIPAVKGVEFGEGFGFAALRGSEANDSYLLEEGAVKTRTNHNGGLLGGITTGMPLIVRACFKPTASIFKAQKTLNFTTKEQTELTLKGRHDACILVRAMPVMEAAVALALTDVMLEATGYEGFGPRKGEH